MRMLLAGARALGAVAVVDLKNQRSVETMHYVRWDDSATGGEVSIEGASSPDYPGAWPLVQAVPYAGSGREDAVRVLGVYGALRHRITSDILGGTVTTGYTTAV